MGRQLVTDDQMMMVQSHKSSSTQLKQGISLLTNLNRPNVTQAILELRKMREREILAYESLLGFCPVQKSVLAPLDMHFTRPLYISSSQQLKQGISLLTNLNRPKPFLSWLHHKQPNTLTNTLSFQRRLPRCVLPIPIVQVARRDEAQRGREDADAAPTNYGQREVQLRLLQQILYRQGASPWFLDAYEDNWSWESWACERSSAHVAPPQQFEYLLNWLAWEGIISVKYA